MTSLFADSNNLAGIRIDRQFPCTHARLWEALTDAEELSEWLGGPCAIEPRVGGRVRFGLAADGIIASGVVRACDPPRPGYRSALLEHTFVDNQRPNVTSVCRWGVTDLGARCELHFTHDGFDEGDRGNLTDAWTRRLGEPVDTSLANGGREAISIGRAEALLSAGRTVLLVSFIGPEVPTALINAGITVVAKTGPGSDDWGRCEVHDGELRCPHLDSPPPVDLVHLDVAHAFDEYLGVAVTLGAKTFWYHSARTRPPEPHDSRGCWVPARQSERQRQLVEQAGLTYIDDVYIADVARGLSETSGGDQRV